MPSVFTWFIYFIQILMTGIISKEKYLLDYLVDFLCFGVWLTFWWLAVVFAEVYAAVKYHTSELCKVSEANLCPYQEKTIPRHWRESCVGGLEADQEEAIPSCEKVYLQPQWEGS